MHASLKTHTHTQIQIPGEKLRAMQHFHRFTASIMVTFDSDGKCDCSVKCVALTKKNVGPPAAWLLMDTS